MWRKFKTCFRTSWNILEHFVVQVRYLEQGLGRDKIYYWAITENN